jgi:hypothetical protein
MKSQSGKRRPRSVPTLSKRQTAYVCSALRPRGCSADFQFTGICPSRREPRRFCGARLCEPQHLERQSRAGFVKTLGGRQISCGSQTRAPLVASSPCWAGSAALIALLALGSVAQAHPGHDSLEHGVAHAATSPYHLLSLAIVALALAVAARFVRSLPARMRLRLGAVACFALAAAWAVISR